MDDLIRIKGRVHARLVGPDGMVKKEGWHDNLITTAGKTALAAWLAASTQSGKFMPYMAIGTSTTAPAEGQTALVAEVARVVGSISSSVNVYQQIAVYNAGVGTGTIEEGGLISLSSAGTLFCRALIGPYAKGALDTLTLTWTVTFN